MADSQFQQHVDADLRAIGLFVVEFGQLVFWIRRGIQLHMGGPANRQLPLNLLMGEATAKPLSNALFAMYRDDQVPPPAGEDLRMLKKIEDEIGAVVTLRNDVMHGDWFVGFAPEGATEPSPAVLMRTKPSSRSGTLIVQELTTDDLERLTDRVKNASRLVQQLNIFMLDESLRAEVYRDQGLANIFEIFDGRPRHRAGAPGFKFD